VLAGPWSSWL